MNQPQFNDTTKEEIKKFLNAHGTRALKTMELAGRYKPFRDALNTELGRELLGDLLLKKEILLNAIINERPPKKMTIEQTKAEFRVIKDLLNRWSEKIGRYNQILTKIKEG